jgi:hypothetical protein
VVDFLGKNRQISIIAEGVDDESTSPCGDVKRCLEQWSSKITPKRGPIDNEF